MKIAILTTEKPTEHMMACEKPFISALKKRGHFVEEVAWNKNQNWNEFNNAIIRTTWDYQDYYPQFIESLEKINRSSCTLFNPLETVKWNSNKNYLFDLERKGLPIIPTRKYSLGKLYDYFGIFDTEKIIVKPTISASSKNTFLIESKNYQQYEQVINHLSNKKEFIIQPFIPDIQSEGEFSLQFFNGVHSHTILKKPKEGDFRSQEEYGSHIVKVVPEKSLLKAGEEVLSTIDKNLLYARVDFVRHQDHFQLMELEIIEPCLYFNFDERAAMKLVDSLEYLNHSKVPSSY